jgi:transposase
LNLLGNEIRSGPIVNIDETVVQVLNEPGRANTSKSYMWIFRGGDPAKPVLVYQYHPTRSGQVPLDFLSGYQGYVQTDAYTGYDALGRRKGIILLGCWSHARRKFVEVIKAKSDTKRKGSADEALEYIGRLYEIESYAKKSGYSVAEIYQLRQERSKPILIEFKNWLMQKSLVTPPKGLLGKAVHYTLDNWERLERYIEDGRLRPDNNLAENAIRPFVVGRKNWLFSGHPNGAAASAAIYSLIETAKANNLKPYEYIRFLFDKLPFAQTEEDYKKLLPMYVDPAVIKIAA